MFTKYIGYNKTPIIKRLSIFFLSLLVSAFTEKVNYMFITGLWAMSELVKNTRVWLSRRLFRLGTSLKANTCTEVFALDSRAFIPVKHSICYWQVILT
jgi:hypothetical protein